MKIRANVRIFFTRYFNFVFMFANNYLQKNNNKALIDEAPQSETGIIVVIPCLSEPEIIHTLESVARCCLPRTKAEVIILINHSETADSKTKTFNKKTKHEIDCWIKKQANPIRFYATDPIPLKKKWAGAGLARKKGMDEAVRRFSMLNKKDGIIISLDADTLVEENYLATIEKHFSDHPRDVGATIAFEHRKKGLNTRQLKGICLYEKYLTYYKNALKFTGYPYAMHTIGSAFAVKAEAYVKRGGMNRRQAGEDFYFLQHLVLLGNVGEITTTTVHPSARLSERVPFGTGPILKKWMNGEEDLTQTYNFKAFGDLKLLFDARDTFYKIEKTSFRQMLDNFPNSISDFIKKDSFENEIADLNRNCSSLQSFQNRFFQKFNAFKILKYLNFAHEKYYSKVNMEKQERLIQS